MPRLISNLPKIASVTTGRHHAFLVSSKNILKSYCPHQISHFYPLKCMRLTKSFTVIYLLLYSCRAWTSLCIRLGLTLQRYSRVRWKDFLWISSNHQILSSLQVWIQETVMNKTENSFKISFYLTLILPFFLTYHRVVLVSTSERHALALTGKNSIFNLLIWASTCVFISSFGTISKFRIWKSIFMGR